ncbi:hypothetical protein [Companilactobacillus versmoldensis]|uniref:Uncharacterized protein n=1 Tax=Companilactobacillus versmoldensis DSM 14857 = KCTC 3814 TaxID=1423815 RepID=A0A0R1SE51_9LACO|nr:hypothetical protein [Companilactobacillus versmoldensis]KRL66953.1 hypothetical protein FC27_GL002279 [Companilactobacillus versmoldensis DSM 14857 = KCTC 3814]
MKERRLDKPIETIVLWLQECSDKEIKPWQYDLKWEIYYHLKPEDHGVMRFLKSRAGYYWDAKYLPDRENTVEVEDCILMQCIYKLLWKETSKYATAERIKNKSQENYPDADIMNSFWSPYKKRLNAAKLIPNNAEQENITKAQYRYQENLQELLDKYNLDKYSGINAEYGRFAEMTHTIGNCTLLPIGFKNNNRMDWVSTWSERLAKMNAKLKNGSGQEKYNKDFYMEDYKSKWSYNDPDYVEKTVNAINHRGKLMTAHLCGEILQNTQHNDKPQNIDIKMLVKKWGLENLLNIDDSKQW